MVAGLKWLLLMTEKKQWYYTYDSSQVGKLALYYDILYDNSCHFCGEYYFENRSLNKNMKSKPLKCVMVIKQSEILYCSWKNMDIIKGELCWKDNAVLSYHGREAWRPFLFLFFFLLLLSFFLFFLFYASSISCLPES